MKKIIIFLLIIISSQTLLANCIDSLETKRESINQIIAESGGVYITSCTKIEPYVHIVLVDMDNSTNKISITHAKKESKGYPLKTITELAHMENATIAINGFKWRGDPGIDKNQYALSPTGTVYSKGTLLHKRQEKKEAVLVFLKRVYKGTGFRLYDRVGGENIPQNNNIEDADNTRDSIIKHNVATYGTSSYQTSSIGVGKIRDKNILIIISSVAGEGNKLEEYYKIFEHFNASEAIRLDGNSATSLFVNGKHVNPLKSGFSMLGRLSGQYQKKKYGSARHIMYAITVKKVPPLPKPQAPTLEGGVNIVPIKGGFRINSRQAQGDVSRYEFYRSQAQGELGDKIHEDTTNTYEDTGLSDGVTYYYTIKACNDAGCATSNQDYNTYHDTNTTDDPTQDPNKVCVSNYFKYYGNGKIKDSLKKGDKDAQTYSDGTKHQVKELQEFLQAFGYNVGSSGADGWFGSDTKDALIVFQSNNGLDADGIVGPNTRDTMNAANCYDKE